MKPALIRSLNFANVLTKIRQALPGQVQASRGIKVYALIGKSGTGKSFRARLVADTHGIDTIIDDGLMIQSGKIIAGRSAKQTGHYIAAIKTAMFNDMDHRNEVLSALGSAGLDKILLLGTSERMILRNCQTLRLPDPFQVIRIEDIATQEQIEAAIHDRKTHGKHVIPLPVLEVKQAYPKLVAQAVKVWFDHMVHRGHYEKTIVRPSFHNKPEVTISEAALVQMLLHCMREKMPELALKKIKVKNRKKGYDLDIRLSLPYGTEAANACQELHDYTIRKIEGYTGITINRLQLNIESVHVKDSETQPQSGK